MRRLYLPFLLILLFNLLTPQPAIAQQNQEENVAISSHQPGQAVQGLVTVRGSTLAAGFKSYELAFGYADDNRDTWFLIAEGTETVENDILAVWDTGQISDGNYDLRLTVYLEGDRRIQAVVANLRVRNYSPIETLTPTATLTATPPTVTVMPSPSATATSIPSETPIPPSVTPLPTNPVEITSSQIGFSLARGLAGAMVFFALAGLYASIRRLLQRQ